MATYDFYRGTYTQVAITITSNEVLGILDTDYIEDYDGVDGQVTLYHPASGVRYPVLMTAIVPETQFRGYFMLASAPLGTYQIQGRVRDKAGNYTVMGALASGPVGGAVALDLEIRDGTGPSGGGVILLEGIDRDKLIFNLYHIQRELVFTGRKLW